jgi:hypothetical protein
MPNRLFSLLLALALLPAAHPALARADQAP